MSENQLFRSLGSKASVGLFVNVWLDDKFKGIEAWLSMDISRTFMSVLLQI